MLVDAAVKALQQMFSPPFRSVLIKSMLLALVMIVLIGVELHSGLTWVTTVGETWAEGQLGPSDR
ncbi:MAG: cysteine biosynthesis protein CysZ, partial [Pseudorhodoplanes sp.]